jgi:hypothetical protein
MLLDRTEVTPSASAIRLFSMPSQAAADLQLTRRRSRFGAMHCCSPGRNGGASEKTTAERAIGHHQLLAAGEFRNVTTAPPSSSARIVKDRSLQTITISKFGWRLRTAVHPVASGHLQIEDQ